MNKIRVVILLCLLAVSGAFGQQSTSFNYQGSLNSGAALAAGTYDFRFDLYGVQTDGMPLGTVTANGVTVERGNFSVQLDFGANAFDGADRFLEISVKQPAESVYTTLTPRQKLSAVPYAIKAIAAETATVAETANNATNLGGLNANQYLLNNGDGSQLVNVGGAIKWNVVTGNQQAVSNNGYYLNSQYSFPGPPPETTLNLPTNPQVGDVVRVSGNGPWRITLNAGQFVTRDGFLTYKSPWTIRTTFGAAIRALVCTPDGSKILASFADGFRISNDYGATWTFTPNTAAPGDYLTISTDGTKMTSLSFGKPIYTSTDAGVTWTAREPNKLWSWIAGSADGMKLTAVVANGQIYTSTDAGATWTPRGPTLNWFGVTSSADGTKLAATAYGNYIYISNDSGVTWTPRGPAGNWSQIKSTPDGAKLFAFLDNAAGIYTSGDSGVTWTYRPFGLASGTCVNYGYQQIAVSDDGVKIALTGCGLATIGGSAGYGVFSWNSGQTWNTGPSANNIGSFAASSDFRYLYGISGASLLVPTRMDSTKTGALGAVTASGGASAELLYLGNGEFTVINSRGTLTFF